MKSKKSIHFLILMLFGATMSFAQPAFISMDPDSAGQGNYFTTVVTATPFFFMYSSAPMETDCWIMAPTPIQAGIADLLNTEQVEIRWSIPPNTPIGNYPVVIGIPHYDPWFGYYTEDYLVPGGVDIYACPSPPASVVSVNGSNQLCYGDSVELTVTTTPGCTYQWYKYDLPIPGATSPSYYAKNSTWSYSCLVTSPSGCNKMSNVVTVFVSSVPSSYIWTTPANNSYCAGGSIDVKTYYYSNYTYQWYLNGNPISGANGATYNATQPGPYSVLVTSNVGCSKLSSVLNVYELPLPAAPIAANGPTTFCVLDSVVLSTNQVSGYQYQWYKYGNYIPFATSSSYTVTKSGKYKVRVMDTNGCSRKSGSITATVIPLPQASISANGPTTFCAGDSVLLSAIINSGDTYQWKKYSNLLTGETSPDLNVKVPGKYKCIVTNSYGCSRTSNKIIVSVPCRTALQSSAIVNADVPFKLINNHLVPAASTKGQLAIFSIEGKQVVPYHTFIESIDLQDFATGVYIVQYIGDDHTNYHEKIMIGE